MNATAVQEPPEAEPPSPALNPFDSLRGAVWKVMLVLTVEGRPRAGVGAGALGGGSGNSGVSKKQGQTLPPARRA